MARPPRPRSAPRRSAASPPVELALESLAPGGDALAHLPDGRVVFVARGAPGDRVEVELDDRTSPARARILRVIEPGPGRVEPACPVVARCGGCDWMHLAEGAQQSAHAAIVRSSIARATGSPELPEVRVHAAPSPLAYRTRARLYVRAERGHVRVGYREQGSHALTPVEACAVLAEPVAAMLGELRDVLAGAAGDGDALVGLGRGGEPVVDLAFRGTLAATSFAALDARVRAGVWAGARVRLEGVAAPAVYGDPTLWMEGADGAPLAIAPGGFAQPSPEGAAMLARRAAELAAPAPGRPRKVVELFSGSGTLSVLLARDADAFVGVEIDPVAVEHARQNLASRGLTGRFVARDADDFAIPQGTEIVVLDPPRTGAKGAARAIAASKARVVVYVSCDPATLARDLAVLVASGLAVTDLETFELFPQTSHIETVVRLGRGSSRAGALSSAS